MRKKSTQSLSLIQRKIWALCRQICVIRDVNPDGSISCYTCPATRLEGANRQLGHLWAKASLGAYLKYDLRLLRWQCFRCNIHMGGMGADFYKKLKEEIGEKAMTQLELDRNVTVKAVDWYTRILEEYKLL